MSKRYLVSESLSKRFETCDIIAKIDFQMPQNQYFRIIFIFTFSGMTTI